jgi:hypothetical protein
MSSGNADQLPRVASASTERSKARRLLLAVPTFWLGLILGVLGRRFEVGGPLGLAFVALPLALIIGSLVLQRSRPQGEKALTWRNLRHIARLAEVPELGTVIMFYGCMILGLSIATLSLVASYRSPH